MFERHWDGEVG